MLERSAAEQGWWAASAARARQRHAMHCVPLPTACCTNPSSPLVRLHTLVLSHPLAACMDGWVHHRPSSHPQLPNPSLSPHPHSTHPILPQALFFFFRWLIYAYGAVVFLMLLIHVASPDYRWAGFPNECPPEKRFGCRRAGRARQGSVAGLRGCWVAELCWVLWTGLACRPILKGAGGWQGSGADIWFRRRRATRGRIALPVQLTVYPRLAGCLSHAVQSYCGEQPPQCTPPAAAAPQCCAARRANTGGWMVQGSMGQ